VLSDEEKASINNFLNEATWLHLYLYPEKRAVGFALHVLTLPESGPESDDIARGLVLFGVSRVFASYRKGRWNDEQAEVVPLTMEELVELPTKLGPQAIYGSDFIDPDSSQLDQDVSRPSIDLIWDEREAPHCASVSKEPGSQDYLGMWVWFTEAQIQTAEGKTIDIRKAGDGARRWCDSLRAGDDRTRPRYRFDCSIQH